MKKMLILAAAAALCACSNPNKYVIEGTLSDFEGTLYLVDQEQNLLDSAVVEKGAFRFEGEAAHPGLCYLLDNPVAPQSIAQLLILEPGTILVSAASEEELPTVTGTPSNDAYTAYAQRRKELVTEYRDPETSEERRLEVDAEIDRLSNDTYAANVGNYFGAMLLQSEMTYFLSGHELLDEIAKYPAAMQEYEPLASLKQLAEKKARVDVGEPYIDVAQPNADGETVTLKSVIENPANKYTLVDFWASWCPPCMGEVPYLVKTYAAFHDKGFEIYGISFDRPGKRENWLGAIEKNQMNWIHVSELNYFNNQAAEDYAVKAIPTNFLIDSEGRIIDTNLRGDALYEKIAELLGE